MSDGDEQADINLRRANSVSLRFASGSDLKEDLLASAKSNNRSLNSEILARLGHSLFVESFKDDTIGQLVVETNRLRIQQEEIMVMLKEINLELGTLSYAINRRGTKYRS